MMRTARRDASVVGRRLAVSPSRRARGASRGHGKKSLRLGAARIRRPVSAIPAVADDGAPATHVRADRADAAHGAVRVHGHAHAHDAGGVRVFNVRRRARHAAPASDFARRARQLGHYRDCHSYNFPCTVIRITSCLSLNASMTPESPHRRARARSSFDNRRHADSTSAKRLRHL